jgi:hypothetical protein
VKYRKRLRERTDSGRAHAFDHEVKGGAHMTSAAHEPMVPLAAPTSSDRRRLDPGVWPSIAIGMIWLVVGLDALFGPDIVTSNGSGTNTSSTPSAVVLSLFAFLTSWVVARYAFRQPK